MWIDDLKPIFSNKFFFEDELKQIRNNNDFWFESDFNILGVNKIKRKTRRITEI